MNQEIKEQILQKIKDYHRIILSRHIRPDGDAVGSTRGLAGIIRATWPDKEVYVVNRDMADYLSFLGPEDSAPEDALWADALAIVMDTATEERISNEKISLCQEIIKIDHHIDIKPFGDLSWVEDGRSSTCEMVAEILQYMGDNIRIRQAEADAMYAGIVIDTNNFMNKTGVRTFEAAAFLRRNGADVTRVRKIFRDSMSDYKAKAEAVRHAEVFEDAFAISICPADGVESPTIIGAQAANELLNIVGIKASIVLTEYQNKIYISARSIDEVNVQLIMEKLGGGGHMSVAGAQLKGCTIEQGVERVKATIKKMLDEGEL